MCRPKRILIILVNIEEAFETNDCKSFLCVWYVELFSPRWTKHVLSLAHTQMNVILSKRSEKESLKII